MLLAYIYRSITHRVHFLDKASRDLLICAKDLFVEAKRPTPLGPRRTHDKPPIGASWQSRSPSAPGSAEQMFGAE